MLEEGLQRGVSRFRRETEGGEHSGRWAGSSARMLLMEELRGVSGIELLLLLFFLLRGDVRRHHSHEGSREQADGRFSWPAGSKGPGPAPGKGFLRGRGKEAMRKIT